MNVVQQINKSLEREGKQNARFEGSLRAEKRKPTVKASEEEKDVPTERPTDLPGLQRLPTETMCIGEEIVEKGDDKKEEERHKKWSKSELGRRVLITSMDVVGLLSKSGYSQKCKGSW